MKKSGMPPMTGMKKMNPFGKTPKTGAMKSAPAEKKLPPWLMKAKKAK